MLLAQGQRAETHPGGEQSCIRNHIRLSCQQFSIKVGITRTSQMPTRAGSGLLSFTDFWVTAVSSVWLKSHVQNRQVSDLRWRKMCVVQLNHRVLTDSEIKLHSWKAGKHRLFYSKQQWTVYTTPDEIENAEILTPVQYPQKVSSMNLIKRRKLAGQITGIKGQYLIWNRAYKYRKSMLPK